MELTMKIETMKQQYGKSVFAIDEAANYLGITKQDMSDLVINGDIRVFGNNQDKIRLIDLVNFETGNTNNIASCYCNDLKINDLINTYFEKMNGVNQSRTFCRNLTLSKHISVGLGEYNIHKINGDVLQQFINSFSNEKYKRGGKISFYSQDTINRVYNLLHTIIVEGVDRGYFPHDLMHKIRKPSTKKCTESKNKAFTDKEVNMIINSVKSDIFLKTYIHILLYTGMRPSEALAIKIQDIDFETGTISVNRTLSFSQKADIKSKKVGTPSPIIKNLKNERNGKKLLKKRVLKVSDTVLRVIRAWILHGQNDLFNEKKNLEGSQDFLFCGINGQFKEPNYYFLKFKRHIEKQGLKYQQYNLYRFRHNFCTRSLRQGFDPKIVQALMGDETLEMVLRVYASINEDEVIKASEEFSQNMDYTLELADDK